MRFYGSSVTRGADVGPAKVPLIGRSHLHKDTRHRRLSVVTSSSRGDRVDQLLSELPNGESVLARRCHQDREFYSWLRHTVGALRRYYGQLNATAPNSFDRKIYRWLKNPPESYIGLVGELHVAHWLAQRSIPHSFVDEVPGSPTPDLGLSVEGTYVSFEIKTMQESPYHRFAEMLLDAIAPYAPDRGVDVKRLKIVDGQDEALVARAVEIVRRDWLAGPFSPIEYRGTEGELSFVLRPGAGVECYWPESGVRADGTPWLESQLGVTLRDSIAQFQGNRPTFLIWVNWDPALPSIKVHVVRVIARFGCTDHADVAGVVICDPFVPWCLIPNPGYLGYRELKASGVLGAIARFGDTPPGGRR